MDSDQGLNDDRYDALSFLFFISFLFFSFSVSRRPWTDEEDDAIRLMVAKHGTKSWALIAENLAKEGMPGRSGKQCRERWHNHLGTSYSFFSRWVVISFFSFLRP
jgi:hypothetical protein